jgi:hypothetical protein
MGEMRGRSLDSRSSSTACEQNLTEERRFQPKSPNGCLLGMMEQGS